MWGMYGRGRMSIRQGLMVGVHAPGALGRQPFYHPMVCNPIHSTSPKHIRPVVTIGERNLFLLTMKDSSLCHCATRDFPWKRTGGIRYPRSLSRTVLSLYNLIPICLIRSFLSYPFITGYGRHILRRLTSVFGRSLLIRDDSSSVQLAYCLADEMECSSVEAVVLTATQW